MYPSSATSAPRCPRCGAQMIVSMISPVTDDDDRHVADDISYQCPSCGTETERKVPVTK